MNDDREHDDADAIAMAENIRLAAKTTRQMFNAYLAEGFSEPQALALTRTWIVAAGGNTE